jgi:acetyl esterase/lipase
MMDMRERLDPELVAPLDDITTATGGGFNLRDIPATRAMVDTMVASVNAELLPIKGVETEDRRVPGPEQETDVPVRIYRPTAATAPLPALVWMHPGGFVIGNIELDDIMARMLAKDVGCVVVSVDYRLSPEFPYPAPLEDCYSVLKWVGDNAAGLGVVPGRIAVGGASAGGGLAAGLALLARDRGEVRPCFQMLIYPAINDRNIAQVADGFPENLFWSRENTLIGWRSYLAGAQATDRVAAYAAPHRAADVSGLPPAYLAVGSLDMFLPDCLDYTRRMVDAGVATELHVYPGAFHAFDAFAPMAQVSAKFVADRNAALARALA